MSYRDGLTDPEFNAIRQLIFDEAGISLSDAKRSLVQSRLAKRLRELELETHSDYLDYLRCDDRDGSELQRMINCLTTNKTDFFREPHHFDYLRDVVFPSIRERAKKGGPREIKIWSSACSMGDEPYTIAITILKHFGSLHGWNVRILATDINTEVLDAARHGVYAADKIEMLSDEDKRQFFLRGTGDQRDRVRVRDELRRLVDFRQLNLLAEPLQVRERFDVIFCRNVIIYFDETTQRKLLPQFADRLNPDGWLMLGHSENVPWLSNQFEALGGTIHQLKSSHTAASPVSRLPTPTVKTPSKHRRTTTPASDRLSQRHSLIAGETYASKELIEISTVLGSCIATCLYDPVAKVGGMNHFMLPTQDEGTQASARYGVHAMELLINQIMQLGGDRRRFEAKIFGGATVLSLGPGAPSIGQMNIEFVQQFLDVERIPLVAKKIGGENALRVHFQCHTGKAFVKEVSTERTILTTERQLALESLVKQIVPSEEQVILF